MARRKKTKYDLIRDEILNYQTFNQTSYIPSEEMFGIFSSYIEVPDYETLSIRYIKDKMNGFISREKGKDGVRMYYSTNTGGFSNIETEKDIILLNGALEQLGVKNAGIKKGIDKVQARKAFVENQISIDDLLVGGKQ